MAEEIKMQKQLAGPLLPSSVPAEKTKKQQQEEEEARASASPDPFPAVRLVSRWGLYNAGVVAFTFVSIHTLSFIKLSCVSDMPPWLCRPLELTETEGITVSALLLGQIWCAVAQAAAATPALLLTGQRRRRIRLYLAYVVLAAAVADHYMHASIVRILVAADPGYNLINRILTVAPIFGFAVGDLVCLALLVGRKSA